MFPFSVLQARIKKVPNGDTRPQESFNPFMSASTSPFLQGTASWWHVFVSSFTSVWGFLWGTGRNKVRRRMRCVTTEVWSHLHTHGHPHSVAFTWQWAGPDGSAGCAQRPLQVAALPLPALFSQRTSVSACLINLCLNGIAVGRKAAMPKWNNHLDPSLSCFASLTFPKNVIPEPAGQELKWVYNLAFHLIFLFSYSSFSVFLAWGGSFGG